LPSGGRRPIIPSGRRGWSDRSAAFDQDKPVAIDIVAREK
jgi:hypothetical protein